MKYINVSIIKCVINSLEWEIYSSDESLLKCDIS